MTAGDCRSRDAVETERESRGVEESSRRDDVGRAQTMTSLGRLIADDRYPDVDLDDRGSSKLTPNCVRKAALFPLYMYLTDLYCPPTHTAGACIWLHVRIFAPQRYHLPIKTPFKKYLFIYTRWHHSCHHFLHNDLNYRYNSMFTRWP